MYIEFAIIAVINLKEHYFLKTDIGRYVILSGDVHSE